MAIPFCLVFSVTDKSFTCRLSPNQIQKLLNQYLVADYEQPINGEIMKAVASKVTEKSDVLLLQAVDMDDSGPYEIAEPRVITALETYTPSCKCIRTCHHADPVLTSVAGLQTPRLKRLAEIVSAQAIAQQEKMEYGSQGDEFEGGQMNDLAEVDETPEAIQASA
jgi:myosin-5